MDCSANQRFILGQNLTNLTMENAKIEDWELDLSIDFELPKIEFELPEWDLKLPNWEFTNLHPKKEAACGHIHRPVEHSHR